MLACRGGAQDSDLVLGALREAVRGEGPDAPTLWTLVDGAGRLGIACAAPVLRHIYRETASSHLRGRAARALAATDPSFAAGFAVECLWDCEETTRESRRPARRDRRRPGRRTTAPARRRPGRGGRGPDSRTQPDRARRPPYERRLTREIRSAWTRADLPGAERNAHGTFPVRKDPR